MTVISNLDLRRSPMWYIVILTYWKHWNSEHGKVTSHAVYAKDVEQAISLASDGYAVHSLHKVIRCGLEEPSTVFYD